MKNKLARVFIFILMIGLLAGSTGCKKTETFVQKTWNRTSYGITKFVINDISADLNIVSSLDGQIHIMYSESEYTYYDISIDGNGVLSFVRNNSEKTPKKLEQAGSKVSTTIAIPMDFAGDVSVTLVSSNLIVDTVSLSGNLSAETVTGNIAVSGSKIGTNAKLSSTSGSISVIGTELASGELTLNNVSAPIELENCNISQNITADTVSSNMTLNKVRANNYRLTSTSGNISLMAYEHPSGYTITTNTTTGIVNAPHGLEGSGEIFAKTTSGNITIAFTA